jgi:hypothetical protein
VSRSGSGVSGDVVGCSGFMTGPAAGHGLRQRCHNVGTAGGETVRPQQEPTAVLTRRNVLLADLGGTRAWLCLKLDLMPADTDPEHQVEDREPNALRIAGMGDHAAGGPRWRTTKSF